MSQLNNLSIKLNQRLTTVPDWVKVLSSYLRSSSHKKIEQGVQSRFEHVRQSMIIGPLHHKDINLIFGSILTNNANLLIVSIYLFDTIKDLIVRIDCQRCL